MSLPNQEDFSWKRSSKQGQGEIVRKHSFAIIALTLFFLPSCSDLLRTAADKGKLPEPAIIAADFNVQQGNDNRENLMTWTNPLSSDFSGVRLLKKTDGFPTGCDDADATLLYEGTGIRYRDSRLEPGSTYYYGIYVKSGTSYSDAGVFGSRQVTETALDIRKRSFFLIGGSSSYGAPTANLVASVNMYDPLTQQLIVNVATLTNPRVFCAVASVNGKIYVFGGKDNSGVSNKVDILDIATMTWTSGTVMPQARCGLVAVPYNGRIYCLGGSNTADTAGVQAGNYIYDIASNTWPSVTGICADLSSARCAFNGVAFRGMLYYFGGVTAAGNWTNDGQYRNLFTNQSVALGGLLYFLGCTQAFYYKDFSDGSEVAIFFTMGGSSTNTQTALPAAALNLLNNYLVYAAFMPNPTGLAPAGYRVMPPSGGGSGIENFTNRAYAGCEYYGDYIYLFGGLAGSPVPIASTLIERLDVKNGDLYNGEWTSTGVDVLSTPRYGFGITRVND
ncbi:MAG: hypothetical protein NT005_08795 [Spirochaetes bacterium]|nr:hypothetical protein [Spirochaetota bacterium]